LSQPQRIGFLDFARGFAISTIVAFHALLPVASGIWATAILFGASGIHAFVFLSGFGLTVTTLQRSLDGFYRRRFRRILVPYFVFVTSIYLLNQIWPIYPGQGLRAYLGHVLLFKMFDESIITSFGYHLWFISTIIQLYLVFPLLFRYLKYAGPARLVGTAVAISALFTVAVILSGRADQRVFNSSGAVYLWEFSLGMAMAQRYWTHGERFWDAPLTILLSLAAIGMALQAALSWRGGPVAELLNNPASMLGYGCVVILAYRACLAAPLNSVAALMHWLSGVSYELYLVHGLIITRCFRVLAPARPAAQLLVALEGVLLSLLVAAAFQRLLSTSSRKPRRCSSEPAGLT
jgi:peptidoglycan/LPS O-acetylase OafA/YrhL